MAARVFISYSHKDEELREPARSPARHAQAARLGCSLARPAIAAPATISTGQSATSWTARTSYCCWFSPDFIASDYCYKIEKGRALERHARAPHG